MSWFSRYPTDPIYNLKRHLKEVQKLHAKYPVRTQEQCDEHVEIIMRVIEKRKPLGVLKEPMRKCIDKLFGSIWINEILFEDRTYLTNLQGMFTDPDLIERTSEALICATYVMGADEKQCQQAGTRNRL